MKNTAQENISRNGLQRILTRVAFQSTLWFRAYRPRNDPDPVHSVPALSSFSAVTSGALIMTGMRNSWYCPSGSSV